MNPGTAPSPQTAPAATAAKGPGLEPTFVGALRGIWLFTWRPQLALRRLPLVALGLFVLPAVIYLTTFAPGNWPRHHSFMDNPGIAVNELVGRLARAGHRLKPDQQNQVAEIFRDEFRRSEEREFSPETPDALAEQQRAEVKACYDRIHARVQPV